MHSHVDCRKCQSDALSATMRKLDAEGLTFRWEDADQIRVVKRWWPFSGVKVQMKQVKIATPPEQMPHGVYRWKTIEVRS